MIAHNNLLFIFSLPRSGSTLLQRSLAAQAHFVTAPETWVLIKLLGGAAGISEYSEYGSSWATKGVSEFYDNQYLGEKKATSIMGESYLAMLNEGFPEHAGEYFIEKTPRNSLIAGELIETFPNAKFIFLWRHPAAVVHSMNETWSRGHWHFRSDIDLELGWEKLVNARRELGDRAISINYEDLTENYEQTLTGCLRYLNLPTTKINQPLTHFSNSDPTMGDKLGVRKFGNVIQSHNAWLGGYENFYRRYLLRKYYRHAERRNLNFVGYSDECLDEALKSRSVLDKYLLFDLLRKLYSQLFFKTGIEVVMRRIIKGRGHRRFGVY